MRQFYARPPVVLVLLLTMIKNVAPATSINIADMVTYGIVGCIALSFLVAFILWH